MKSPIVQVNPEVMSGAPCFAGTRVPVQTLVDSIATGETIDGFLEGFPGVTREQTAAFLRESAGKILVGMPHPGKQSH